MIEAIRKLFEALDEVKADSVARDNLIARLRGVRDAGNNGAVGAQVLNAVIRVLKRVE